jgi:hypothetical protein
MNFNIQQPALFVFLGFQKTTLLKVVRPFKTYQHATFHGPMLTQAIFASTSGV